MTELNCSITSECIFSSDIGITLANCNTEISQCECSAEIGYVGEICSEVSPHVIVHAFVHIGGLIINLTFSVWILVILRKVFSINFEEFPLGKQKGFKKTKSRIVTILCFLWLFAILNCFENLHILFGVFDPTFVEHAQDSGNSVEEVVVIKGNQVSLFVLGVQIFSVLVFLLTVNISFIEIIEGFDTVVEKLTNSTVLTWAKRALYFILIIVGVSFLPFQLVDSLDESQEYFYIILTALLFFLTIGIKIGFYIVLKDLKYGGIQETVALVNYVNNWHLVTFLIGGASGVVSLSLEGAVVNAGELDFTQLILDLFFIVIQVVLLTVDSNYCLKITANLQTLEESTRNRKMSTSAEREAEFVTHETNTVVESDA